MREDSSSRPVEAGEAADALFGSLREECGAPPEAPDFLAGFRARREVWLERRDQAAPWRSLALRLAPAGALAAVAALAITLGAGAPTAPEETRAEAPPITEVPDPFTAGLEEAGVVTLAMGEEEAGFELLAVLYDPTGTP